MMCTVIAYWNHQWHDDIIVTGATDADNDTMVYSLVTGDSEIHRYFYIDDRSGIIYLRSALVGVDRQSFTFRVRVSDGTFPEKSDEANVVIRVTADRNRPVFLNACNNRTIREVCEIFSYIFNNLLDK